MTTPDKKALASIPVLPAEQQPHPLVVRGARGQLFISKGRHVIEEHIFQVRKVSDESFRNFEENLASRRAQCARAGAQYLHVVCPDKQSVYQADYPHKNFINLGDLYAERTNQCFLYPREELQSAQAQHEVFFRTDSHYNDIGGHVVTQAILKAFGIRYEMPSDATLVEDPDLFIGDCGARLEPQDGERTYRYAKPASRLVYDNRFQANLGIMEIRLNPLADPGRKLLVFGDSFLRYCLPALSDVFSQILYVRTPYFHPEAVASFGPSHVISANVERYLSFVKPDQLAPNFLMMPLLRGLQVDPANPFFKVLDALLGVNKESLDQQILTLASNLQVGGQPQQALDIVNNCYPLSSPVERSHVMRARALAALGKLDEAIRGLERALVFTGRTSATLGELGALQNKSGAREAAVATLREALALDKASPFLMRSLAVVLSKQGQHSEALDLARRAVNLAASKASFIEQLTKLEDAAKKAQAPAPKSAPKAAAAAATKSAGSTPASASAAKPASPTPAKAANVSV